MQQSTVAELSATGAFQLPLHFDVCVPVLLCGSVSCSLRGLSCSLRGLSFLAEPIEQPSSTSLYKPVPESSGAAQSPQQQQRPPSASSVSKRVLPTASDDPEGQASSRGPSSLPSISSRPSSRPSSAKSANSSGSVLD
jgi:hypothetical protein